MFSIISARQNVLFNKFYAISILLVATLGSAKLHAEQTSAEQINAFQASSENESSVFINLSELTQIGQADMDFLWFDVYLARLYSKDGKYQQNTYPLALDIEYHRDISASELIEATLEQWEHIGLTTSLITDIQLHLLQAWPDVRKGDRLTFILLEPNQGEFRVNDELYYRVNDEDFNQAFMGIWLSEKTSRPELRMQLISSNSN